MNIELLIQYPDRDPQDYDNCGIVDLDKAISIFEKFDREKHFSKIKTREESNLTSCIPEIILQDAEKQEFLSITWVKRGEYDVKYIKDGRTGLDHVSVDFLNNPSGVSVQDIIIDFYENQLEIKIQLEPEEDEEIEVEETLDEIELGKYDIWRYSFPILAFFTPIFLIVCFLLTPEFEQDLIKVICSICGFYAIINSPFILVFSQYRSKPKVNSVILDLKNKTIQINYDENTIKIERKDIHQCAFTYCNNRSKISWQEYSNISLILKDKTQHFLTTLSFSKEELEKIFKIINVNSYKFETSFQFLVTKDYSQKSNINYNDFVKKEELEALYSEYSDEKLEEIVENSKDYLPIAPELAKKELKRRRN
ncbi:MAG: hypothetical protein HXX16_16560 [Bacteroidales bacterium]|nr:hypothetical protein [Bacteroidales bacterium]